MTEIWTHSRTDIDQSIFDSFYQTNTFSDSDLSPIDNRSNVSDEHLDSIKDSFSDLSHSSNRNCFIQPLFPEKIRWFYKEGKLWIPFCGYDSLRLETKYRELANQTTLSDESKTEKIVVRGDLFEVDVLNRTGFPIYWHAVDEEQESFTIIRGTWFREASLQPLDSEKLADKIEKEHLKIYGCNNSTETLDGFAQQLSQKLHLNVKSLVINDYHIDWYDQDNVFIYKDSASHFIRQKLGLTKVGSKLIRGYKYDARIEDKLPDITHLVFVIHGIGQKMKGGDISYQVSRIRAISRKVTNKFFPFLEDSNQRVEFLPVEWRKSLVLDGNTVDLITPNRNKGLRNAVNSTALDVLYYSSPIYRPEMIGSLRSELNRLYSMFCARSPYFEDKGGKVSVIAHSLGVVLIYDILTNWSPAKVYEYIETLDVDNKNKQNHENRMELFSELNIAKEKVHHLELLVLTKAEQENSNRGQVNFRLENLFCLGSPLSVFLALRGLKPQNASTIDHILPESLCKRFFNIFHPADPVVYRMEPLINQTYANIEPVRIYRLDHPNKEPYDSVTCSQICDLDTPLKSEKSLNDDFSSRLTSEPISNSTKSSYTITGKIMKFFHKFKSDTTNKLTDSMVNQVVSNHHIDMLDHGSNGDSTRRKRKKHKSNSKYKNLDTNGEINKMKFFNQSHLSLTKYASFRRSKRSSWKDVALRSQRHSLTYFPEMDLEEKVQHFVDSNYSAFDENLKRNSLLEESSDEETLKSERSASIYSMKNDLENNSTVIPACSTDVVDTPLKVRIDYKLPESRYENSYWSVLTSHTSYWNSPELSMFVLTQIFGHLGKVGNPL